MILDNMINLNYKDIYQALIEYEKWKRDSYPYFLIV